MIVIFGEVSDEDGVVDSLAAGLRALGESVVVGTLGSPGPLGRSGTAADDVAAVVAGAESATGPLDAVVLVSTGSALTRSTPLAALVPDQWRQRVEEPLQQTMALFQGAHRRLRINGGSLVVVIPTLALAGASGFVPWAVVAEGQRSLAKAAARAWGHEGITVNCLAIPGALLSEATSPDRPGQPPPSFRRLPHREGDVALVLLSLVSGGWRAVTGATIAVDGGVWMTP